MFHTIAKIAGYTDSLWHKTFEQLSSFSKALILSGMIVCIVLALLGLSAEIYSVSAHNTSYILRCMHSVTEGGFRCLLLGAAGGAVYEYIRSR